MIKLGNFIAGETVEYSNVFHDDDNTPATPTGVSGRVVKPDDTAANLTGIAEIDSTTGWHGGGLLTTGYAIGTYRIYLTGTVSAHAVAAAYEFEIVTTRRTTTNATTRRYGGVFHNDSNTPASPSTPTAKLQKPDGTVVALSNPAVIDTKTGWFGGDVTVTGFSEGAYIVYFTGTVSAHVIAGVYHFTIFSPIIPGLSTWGTEAVGDGTISGELAAIPSDTDLDVVTPIYRLWNDGLPGAWTEHDDISSPAVGSAFSITGLVNDSVYEVSVISVDTAGNKSLPGNIMRLTPTDATTLAPAGVHSILLQNLDDLIANSGAFQELTGTDNAVEAAAFIYQVGIEEPRTTDRPYCVVRHTGRQGGEVIGGGGPYNYDDDGQLEVVFVIDIPATYATSLELASRYFLNYTGRIIANVKALSGTAGLFNVMRWDISEGPTRARFTKEQAGDNYYRIVYKFDWQ